MRFKNIVMSLVIISLCVKMVFLFASGSYLKPQVFEYEEIARHMLNGEGFWLMHFGSKFYAVEAPGFPVMCFIVYKVFGHYPLLIILIQIIVTSLLVIPIALVAKHIFNERTAFIAGFLTALYPPLIVYATTKLHTMSIYSFLFVLFIWSFLLLKESVTAKRALFAGCISGLSILFRITSLTFFMLAMIWFFYACRETARKKILATIGAGLIFCVIISPWVIRNYFVFGKPLLLQTNKGEAFWFGNIPGSNGGLYTAGGMTVFEKAAKDLPPDFFTMGEIEKEEYLEKITVGYFKKDPAAFIGRVIKKIYYFWYFSPYQGTMYPQQWLRLYKIYYLFILFPALFSVLYNFFLKKKDPADAALIGLLLFTITVAHSLCFVEGRHRWSVEPLLLIFTANAMVILFESICKRRPAGNPQ